MLYYANTTHHEDHIMNNARRKTLDTIMANYSTLYAELATIARRFDALKDELECARDEEQDYYDNMPEGLQSGEKGDAAEQAVSSMDDAIALIEAITEFADSNDEAEFIQLIDEAKA